jgi:hypothetical protein
MNFRRANFRMPLLACALTAVVLPVVAQTNALPSSQPIIFSVPAGDKAATNAPLLLPQLSDRPNLANELQAPVSVFNVPSPPLPRAAWPRAPAPSPAEAQRLRRMLDVRDNWALMTPAEILGVSASANPLRTTEQEAADKQKNLTLIERFLARQQQPQGAVTNRQRNDDSSTGWDFFRNQGRLTNGSPFNPVGLPTAAQILDRFFNDTPANNRLSGQNENGRAGWFRSLGLPPQPTSPTPEQQAERERFRQLLDLGLSSDTPAKPSPDGKSFSPLQLLPDATPNQAATRNPVGATFAPLSSGIGRPTGLTPLPGITSSTNWQSFAAPPAWALQPPPWLLSTPQPFTMPQRKF